MSFIPNACCPTHPPSQRRHGNHRFAAVPMDSYINPIYDEVGSFILYIYIYIYIYRERERERECVCVCVCVCVKKREREKSNLSIESLLFQRNPEPNDPLYGDLSLRTVHSLMPCLTRAAYILSHKNGFSHLYLNYVNNSVSELVPINCRCVRCGFTVGL